jgi:hypothetical protein
MSTLDLTAQEVSLRAYAGDDIEFDLEFELADGEPDITSEDDAFLVEIIKRDCSVYTGTATIEANNSVSVHFSQELTETVGAGSHRWRCRHLYDNAEKQRCLVQGQFTLFRLG